MIFSGHSQISGVGSFIPQQAVSSVDLLEDLKIESRFGIPNTWMDDHLGIVSRRYCEDDDKPSDIATIAALRALDDAGVEPKDLDAIFYCGITGDFIEPGTAHVIQNNLGATKAICKDVTNACHGFCDGIFFADLMIGGGAEHVLVVTAELTRVGRLSFATLARVSDLKAFAKKVGMLSVGDAAGAVLISTKPNPQIGIKLFSTLSYGRASSMCFYTTEMGVFRGAMKMEEIGKVMFKQIVETLDGILNRASWTKSQVQAFIMHQVGKTPFATMSEAAGFVLARTPKTYEQLGNITTATLPVNLKLISPPGCWRKQKLCLAGGGSGIVTTWILIEG